jgi:hypothetical protein
VLFHVAGVAKLKKLKLLKMPDYKAILSGQSWNAMSSLREMRKPVFLTYTLEPREPSFLWGRDWGAFDNRDKDLARQALRMWEDASGIRFFEVEGSEAELKFQWEEAQETTTAWADFPQVYHS